MVELHEVNVAVLDHAPLRPLIGDDRYTTLEGTANGDWVSWYAAFATSPLVLGYYPKSNFVHVDTGRVRFW